MQLVQISERDLKTTFKPVDVDPDFDRASKPRVNVKGLFNGVAGFKEIIERLEGWQKLALNLKELRKTNPTESKGLHHSLPYAIIFKGPPG